LAFDLDGDPVRIVSDEACESLLRGEAVYEWPEADALHDTANQHSAPALRAVLCASRGRFVRFSYRMVCFDQIGSAAVRIEHAVMRGSVQALGNV
jgi:hypothetical protein